MAEWRELQAGLASALGRAEDAVESSLDALARLDAEALEARQEEAFALMHAHARLHGARAARRTGEDAGGHGVELAGPDWLGLTHQAVSLEYLRGALGNLAARDDAPPAPLRAFAEDTALPPLIRAGTGDAVNRRVMEHLAQGGLRAAADAGMDEEMRLLRQSFEAFAEKKVRPMAEALHREDGLIPDDLIAEAAELGCFGLSIPAAHGGVQDTADSLGMVVVTESLSAGALIVGSLITRPEILARALLSGGTPEQQARFLPAMASGEKMVAISVTEPDHGSDVAGLSLAARRTEEGWLLNGAKMWSTFAGRAELLGVLARTEEDRALGHKGLSLFVVEKPPYHGHDFSHAQPGGGRLNGRAIATIGYRGMHSYELQFEDYLVPHDNLVGGEQGRGRGFYLQMEGFAHGRLQTAGRALGVMQAAFDAAMAYAESRRVFGRLLREFPLTRAKLVAMAGAIHAGRQATYAAARGMDSGGQRDASLVKLLTCHQAEWVTREAMQIHGGMGYAEEFPVSRLFADARVLSIFEGTEEVLALRVLLPGLLHGRV